MLSGNFHQGNVANLNFFFNKATGKFEPIFFDAAFTRMNDKIDVRNHRIATRIARDTTLNKEFEEVARAYLTDENLQNDLAFYDEMTEKIRPALYRDTAKVQTTWEALGKIQRERDMYEHNFRTMQNMLRETGTLAYQLPEETYPLSKQIDMKYFTSYEKVFASRAEFLAANSQFRAGSDATTIVLPAGVHVFSRDVIVPAGMHLVIAPGANVLFGPSISLISYSPINAIGTATAPITFRSLIKDISWGVVAIIDTEEQSKFTFASFDNGKDTTINGVYFSGMLSAHHAPLHVTHSSFERAGADDALRTLDAEAIIEYSRFRNNLADNIDIDYAKGKSAIRDNTFSIEKVKDSNGDGMDVSFSSLEITGNHVFSCGDKGISVGERSSPTIKNNIIFGCTYGIAVKDGSHATIDNTILAYNKIGISMYRKKPHLLTGGHPTVERSVIWGNKTNIEKDEFSSITIRNSIVEDGVEGEGNSSTLPNFKALLPPAFLSLIPH
jgi:parallel beta-helix repeat protein